MPVGFEVSAMKASFSLSSLEPSGGLLADSPEHARLRMEKPYNSLTKKPRRAWDSEVENWRRSWGGRDNEDSFLEALLPNYTYLMDNNLIDTCKEADGELCMDHKWQLLEEVAREGKASASQVETLCQEAVEKEIRCLRRWIRGMEKRLGPLDFKTGFAPAELEDKAKEIQCLAVEVEAQGKVVISLIRHCECLVAASAPENQEQKRQQNKHLQEEQCQGEKQQEEEDEVVEQNQSPPPYQDEACSIPPSQLQQHQQPGKGSAAEESLKVAHHLEVRWHHLYLRAIEWQCHIELLLSGNGPNFKRRDRENSNGDSHSLDSGAEHSSFSSEEEEEDTCSGEEEGEKRGGGAGRSEKGRVGEKGGAERGGEGRGLGGGGGARRVGEGEDGGPLPKQRRLGGEACEGGGSDTGGGVGFGGGGPQEGETSQVMEANESAANSRSFPHPQFGAIDSPFPVKKNKMKESQNSERMEITAQNCAYFVIRRIDTDSEAETKGNGIKSEEDREIAEELSSGGEGIANEGRTVQDSEMAMNQDTEEEGDEEDDEWVFSRVPAKVLSYEERDTKAKKSLQYGPKDTKETQTDKSSEKGDSKACGRAFEALKLNATVADVGTKEKNARIKRWLSQGGAKGEESAESQEEQASKRYPIDSCDASGEYTSSGESSEVESQSSGELDGSVATCRKSSAVAAVALATAGWNSKVSPLSTQELGISTLSLTPTDGDITPVAESRAFPGSSVNLSPTGKPVLRSKRRKGKVSSHHQRSPKSEQKRRPWSICVSGPSHLVAMSSNRSGIHPAPIPGSPYSASPTPNSPHHTQMHGTRSTSESAIHCLAYSSSSCSTGLDDIGSNPGRAGTGSDGFTPTRGSVDGEGVGSGAGSTSTGSLKRKKVRTRRRALGQRSESGNSDSVQGELTPMVRRGSRSSSKGMSPGSKGSISQSTSSDYSSSNMVTDETKDEMDEEGIIGHCKEIWKRSGMGQVPSPEEEDEDFENEEGEKLGSLQTEETSSYSEQAWDNYQVCLSEGGDYSSDDDKPAKEQLLLRLMEFGDDYRNHFDSQSDGGSSLARQPPTPCSTLDSFPGDGMRSLPRSHSPTPPSPGSSSRTGSGRRKRQGSLLCNGLSRVRPFAEVTPSSKLPPHFPLTSQGPASLGPIVNLIDDVRTCNPITALDSDSDLEEVNHFLRESRAQVLYTEGVMDKALGGSLSPISTPGKFPPPADYAEIAATCKENIKCLRALLRSMNGMERQEEATLLTPRDFWETKDLVNRWEMLESRAEECHLVRMLRQEIAALRDAMVAPSTGKIRNGRVEDLQNRKELDRRIQEVKAEIAALFELKNELLEVNVSVNRFLTGAAQPVQCPSFTTAGVAPTTNCVSQGAPTLNAAGQENPESAAGRVDFAFLKDDVAELYREWDDSLSRLNTELAALQRASRTWTELEEGLATLGSALNSDRNALTTLSTAVAVARSPNKQQSSMASQVTSGEKAIQTPALLAASVRELARVLSEEKGAVKTSSMGPRGDKEYDEWEISDFMEETDLNGDSHMNFKNSIDPLGSLSDSGISDSGSEGLGMCERGRRLAALRKLARVLAATLGPNSAPLAALKQRMDEAQKELRSLQRTCRDLVVCTAMLCSASQGRGGIIEEYSSEGLGCGKNNSAHDGLLNNNRLGALPSLDDERLNRLSLLSEEMSVEAKNGNLKKLKSVNGGGGGGGGGEGGDDFGSKKKGRGKGRKHWLWRALCCAMPFQLAVVLLLYAAYFLEPHCCSAINNLSFSLSPQLHYVRGPPPT